MDNVLNAREAAEYLKINVQTVRRLAREKRIPAFKVGGSWRFNKATLERWAEAQHKHASRSRILAVDDEPLVLDVISRVLEEQGFDVITASGGAEALALIRRNVPDLVFLDLKMPGMDGPAVLKEIRAHWGWLPVVILTGFVDSELMTKALRFSPITVLAKPAAPEQIAAAIRGALGA